MELDEKLDKHQQNACSLHDQQNFQDTEMQPSGHEPQTASICDEKTCPRLRIPKPIDQSNQPLQQKEHESFVPQRPCCSNAYDDFRKDKDIGKTDDKCEADVESNKENVLQFYAKPDSVSTGLNCPSAKEVNADISSSKKEEQCKPSVYQEGTTESVTANNVDSHFTHKERLAKAFQTNAKFSQAQNFKIYSDEDEDDVQIMDCKSAPQSDVTTEQCRIIFECSKVLTKVPHADKHILLCQDALCAVAKGWTYKTPKISATGQRVTIAEICVAIATYENIDVFPVGSVSDLDQTIIEVTNDLFPQHVEEFYPEFIFQCFCCSASTKKMFLSLMRVVMMFTKKGQWILLRSILALYLALLLKKKEFCINMIVVIIVTSQRSKTLVGCS